VTDQKIRVHYIEYESDADVAVGFCFSDGVTFKDRFARRFTSGVFASNYAAGNLQGPTGYGLYCRVGGAVKVSGHVIYEQG